MAQRSHRDFTMISYGAPYEWEPVFEKWISDLANSHKRCISYVAVVTNGHKLRGLKQHRLSYCPGGQISEISLTRLKLRFQQSYIPSGSSRGQSVSLPSPASRICPHPLVYSHHLESATLRPLFPLSCLLF